LAIGSSREVRGVNASEGGQLKTRVPGATFLLGKVLNAFLLDHIDVDIELLSRVNSVLRDGTAAYGAEFTSSVNAQAQSRGAEPYSNVECLALRPSEDIGRLASTFVRKGEFMGNPMLTRRFLNALDIGAGDEADLASYLLFDGRFCRQLIELGRSDAHARRHELLEFFEGDDERMEAAEDQEAGRTIPPPSVTAS
jgi:NTE family protein